MDADGFDLCPRNGANWTTEALLAMMRTALSKSQAKMPAWLDLVSTEVVTKKRATIAFGVGCYWVGEALLGARDGVLATRIGSLGGGEAVEVDYDPEKVGPADLVKLAAEARCARTVFVRTDAEEKSARDLALLEVVRTTSRVALDTEQKYHLANKVPWNRIPMTEAQASRVNAAVAADEDPSRWLSPAQKKLLERMKKKPAAANIPKDPNDRTLRGIQRLEKAWDEMLVP
jgi:hypothetical protein